MATQTWRVEVESVDDSENKEHVPVEVLLDSGEVRVLQALRTQLELLKEYQGTGLELEVKVDEGTEQILHIRQLSFTFPVHVRPGSLTFDSVEQIAAFLESVFRFIITLECRELPYLIQSQIAVFLREMASPEFHSKLGITSDQADTLREIGYEIWAGVLPTRR